MVESFLNTELEALVTEPEELEKWNNLVNELGLPKQAKLANEEKSPIPFPPMNAQMQRVYEEMCPAKTKLEDYDAEALPTRVLELAALAKRESYFQEMYVWHNRVSPDPILVGCIGEWKEGYLNTKYLSTKQQFVVARWGDELRSFTELRKMAMESWVEKSKASLNEAIAKAKMQLESIDSIAIKHFEGEWANLVRE